MLFFLVLLMSCGSTETNKSSISKEEKAFIVKIEKQTALSDELGSLLKDAINLKYSEAVRVALSKKVKCSLTFFENMEVDSPYLDSLSTQLVGQVDFNMSQDTYLLTQNLLCKEKSEILVKLIQAGKIDVNVLIELRNPFKIEQSLFEMALRKKLLDVAKAMKQKGFKIDVNLKIKCNNIINTMNPISEEEKREMSDLINN